MKKLITIFILFILSPILLNAQVNVSATGGDPLESYTTLRAAFGAINTGFHTGIITISVVGNTTEIASAVLDSSGNGSGSNYTSITISASGGIRSISGSVVGHLIDLNGADNVTINGINSGGTALFINNNATGTSSTLRLVNDATNNVFRNTTFSGSGTTVNACGVIFLSTGFVTGNDNNTFANLNIDGASTAWSCLYSAGTTTTSAHQNSGDTLRDCNLYDYFNSAVASPIGAFLNSGNTDWYISGNSFYQQSARNTASQGVHTGLQIFPAWTSDKHTIINNFVGGSQPGALGIMSYTGTSTNVLGAIGLSIQTGGPGNLIQGNIVRNISVVYNSVTGSFGNAGFFGFIGGYSGTTTFNQNIVENFSITNNGGASLGSGIHMNGRITATGVSVTPTFNITNNIVGNLNFNAGGAGSVQYYGIRLETSSAASITSGTSNPNFMVSGNTIGDLNASVGGASGWIKGIATLNTVGSGSTGAPLWPKATIDNNTIFDINCNSALVSYTQPAVVGIQIAGSSNTNNGVDTFHITRNTIYDLIASNVTDIATSAMGIIGTNASGFYSTAFIARNKIYNIVNTAPGTTAAPLIAGINWRSTFLTTNIQNNYIALGELVTTNTHIFGILNNVTSSAIMNVAYNSIYINGTPASGTRNCAAIYRGSETFAANVTTPFILYDNLLLMARSGGTGSFFALGSFGTASWTSNYNALISSSASTIGSWNNVSYNFPDFRTNSSGEFHSVSLISGLVSDYTVNPSVLSPADLFLNLTPGLNGILDIDPNNTAGSIVNGNGYSIPSISIDYHGDPRGTTTGFPTDIGGDEFFQIAPPPPAVESGTFANGGTTIYSLFGKRIMSILWDNVGTITSRAVRLFAGSTPPGTLINTYAIGYWDVQVNGGATGYMYDITLNYNSAFLGTVPHTSDMRMAKRDNVDPWIWIPSSVPDVPTNSILATDLTSFSQFTLTDQNNPLPVELASFTSSINRNGVVLNWSTSTETNNSGFDIERKSSASEVWNKVANVTGNGTTTGAKNYTFSDNGLQTGNYNYRLKQIDFNGNFQYFNLSSEVIVGVPSKFELSQNYPNPFNPTTKINYDLPVDSKVNLRVYDMLGREVASLVNEQVTAGYYTVQLNATNMASGTYFFRLVAQGIDGKEFVMTKKMQLVK